VHTLQDLLAAVADSSALGAMRQEQQQQQHVGVVTDKELMAINILAQQVACTYSCAIELPCLQLCKTLNPKAAAISLTSTATDWYIHNDHDCCLGGMMFIDSSQMPDSYNLQL
jgi:hypothetical protein